MSFKYVKTWFCLFICFLRFHQNIIIFMFLSINHFWLCFHKFLILFRLFKYCYDTFFSNFLLSIVIYLSFLICYEAYYATPIVFHRRGKETEKDLNEKQIKLQNSFSFSWYFIWHLCNSIISNLLTNILIVFLFYDI